MDPKWDFKTIKRPVAGAVELIDLPPEKSKRMSIVAYGNALRIAAQSQVPNPKFSNYFVRGGIGHELGYEAGNIEYGLCQALHCEESAVNAWRANRLRFPGVLAFSSKREEVSVNNITPCGNCRDIMRDELGPDFDIVCGSPNGGLAIVMSVSDFLLEEYRPFDVYTQSFEDKLPGLKANSYTLRNLAQITLRSGQLQAYDPYSPAGVHPERRYYVHLLTEKRGYFGTRYVGCDYHPMYPVEHAVMQAFVSKDVYIRALIVVTENGQGVPPHVMYRDRQQLLAELNTAAEVMTGREQDPPVYLLSLDGTHPGFEVTGCWVTSVKQWLPFPFAPTAFGDEFMTHLKQYYKQRLS